MTLAAGARLGAFTITGPLGAGGMGEVYRARDTRLGREVAIKVLPAHLAENRDALARFEREARALAALSHPNILSVHEFGRERETAFVVTELLEGETLRLRLQGGALPLRKAVDFATQVAQGLAAAHERGIVHRDLKPENLFLTPDGRVKILDFGLARHEPPVAAEDTSAPTLSRHTAPGMVVGTVGYMSPEQVRGQAVDHRSDLFSFGAVLHEMLTGRRAFHRDTAAETMAAILKEDPPDLASARRDLPPALARIVEHCLEKSVAERFQSARDVAFDLQALSAVERASGPVRAQRIRRSRAWIAAALALALAVAAAGYIAAMLSRSVAPPSFRRLTFRRGHVTSARFTPDGQTVVYGAMWEGEAIRVFSTRLGGPESSALPLPAADVLSVSTSGDLALSLGRRFTEWFITAGRLARAPLAGGAPRELLENVQEAEWAPDGERLLVVRDVGDRYRMELGPVVLYETPGWISHARLSPRGDAVAFVEHPLRGADNGWVALVPTTGKGPKKALTRDWASVQGLAWAPGGREVWFTGAETGWFSALHAATPAGRLRLVTRIPGRLLLHDIDRRGRVLLAREELRVGALYGAAGDPEERDLSWLDASFATRLTKDGEKLLICEQGEGAGANYSLYLRKTDGSPAVRLGEGFLGELSPDERWVLTLRLGDPPRLAVLPTGAGEARLLPESGIVYTSWDWLPDGQRIVFAGMEPGRSVRLYTQDLSGGAPRPLSAEGLGGGPLESTAVSPDGRWVAAVGPEQRVFLCPTDGEEPHPLQGLRPGDKPLRFSSDGSALYCAQSGSSAEIIRFDLQRKRRETWKQLRPRDPTGVTFTAPADITPDGRRYAYTYVRILSDLFLVEGLK